MNASSIFISYSHADEWLKDELIKHFSALKRNGLVDVWHDRRIPAGGILHNEISDHLATSDIFLFLISNDFITSDYCFQKEYEEALKRRDAGDAEIVPVIVRDCDWDVGRLKSFNALPPDAIPVTRGAASKSDSHQRDAAWLKVINELKKVIQAQKKKLNAPSLSQSYLAELFLVDFIRHSETPRFDERSVLIDPEFYSENGKEQISNFERLLQVYADEKAIIITGADRSGKSVIAKCLQEISAKDNQPAVLLSGRAIRNKDIDRLIRLARVEQFEPSDYPSRKFKIIIDDFDECNLPDKIKEDIVAKLCNDYSGCVLISFSNAPSVLFTSADLPTPYTLRISAVTDAKLYHLVEKWCRIGLADEALITDAEILLSFEKLQLIFGQTELEKAPYTAITFLELMDSASASDLAFSSFAACYDTLISSRLQKAHINWRSFDESKNFLALVAYRAYIESGTAHLSKSSFEECLSIFETQFLSSAHELKKMAVSLFVREDDQGFTFYEDYLWFFLCARYVVKTLQVNDLSKYSEFVTHCTENIFQKKFANIVIYIAYFSNDNFVLTSLLATLDRLFSKANDWVLSDDTRDILLGLATQDGFLIEARSDVTDNRVALLQEKIADIVNDAERVVAKYTLPFLSPNIADSVYVSGIEKDVIDADSYMKSVNALLRIHSVIGQILNTRTGTYGASLILDCITRMVQASGRYVSLNHAIATVLIYDKENNIASVRDAVKSEKLTDDEKYEKVTRIFAFWSVYLSHAGLARYLSQEHSIRALERLASEHESETNKTAKGNIPFNFSFVLLVARLYHSGRIDKDSIEDCIKKYGEDSSVMALMRVVMHIYAYYMPLDIADKQWISAKLKMPLKRIEYQRLKGGGLSRIKAIVN